MQTPEFEQRLDALIDLSRREPAAILCAEAVPWRCHRSLIADALTARGESVRHIMRLAADGGVVEQDHQMTSWARVRDGRVTYPGLGLQDAEQRPR